MHIRSAWRSMAALGRHAIGPATVLVLFTLSAPHPAMGAAGLTCTLSSSTLAFGAVNPLSAAAFTSGALGYTCTTTAANVSTVYACLSLGTGTGGLSPTNRTLASGASTIPIQITGGSANPGQIGNGSSYPMEGPFILSVPKNSTNSSSFPIAMTMPTTTAAPPPGSYTSTFSGGDATMIYTDASAPSTCSALAAAAPQSATGTLSVTASVAAQCTTTATSMAFPTASVLTNAVNATATVSVTCNASTPVTVALDNGATGTGPTTRQMKSGTTNAITYGIYQDAAATLPWGNTTGTNTRSLSGGTGTLTAYGRVPAQASPPPGAYSDVVNVIITY